MMGMMGGNYFNGDWSSAPDYMKQMMQSYYGGVQPFAGFFGIAHLIVWVLVVSLLVAAIRFLWKKGSK